MVWKNYIFCKKCQRERPAAIAVSKHRCRPCQRIVERLRKRKQLRTDGLRERDRLRKRREPVDFKRCYDMFKKIRKRAPNHIPKWVNIEQLLPIYRHAAYLDEEEPEYWHIVSHKVPLRLDKDVCGLHTIDNLIIKRSRKLSATAHSTG